MSAVLGLKVGPGHHTGAAIVTGGSGPPNVFAISQERLDRKKNSRSFPRDAIAYCLSAANCELKDIDLVVSDYLFYPGPRDMFPPKHGDTSVHAWSTAFDEAFPESCRKQNNVKCDFFAELDARSIPFFFAEHHLCHAASSYFATEWDDAVALVIDGHGSCYETQSIYTCEGNSITKLATSREPGIGWMYSATTELLLGFGHLEEGKAMGLAGWGVPSPELSAVFEARNYCGTPIESSFPNFCRTTKSPLNWELSAPEGLKRRGRDDDPLTPPFPAYAASAQKSLERNVVALAGYAKRLTSKSRLCYSGGVALNILANRELQDDGLFEQTFIQPACSDAGIPLGAALLGFYSVLGETDRWRMKNDFLGTPYDEGAIDEAIAQWDGEETEYRAQDLARLLANDYLVGWFRGGSEYGPRALGHRSILCSPRSGRMKDYLNRRVKFRESFRPFAPIVPIERCPDFFDLRGDSRFMLLNARVRPDRASEIPAVVHADGTARVQTICRSDQPELHALLSAFAEASGIPILLNTSMNLAGEPIVESPLDAINLFKKSQLHAMVIESRIVLKRPLSELLSRANDEL